mmetsp:Transcript_94931/g.245133  ORF Transcript_94931/g.245133 Transcript_94931/m.245133 type:complete len:232 (+) Transcript_94931:48-743(+)
MGANTSAACLADPEILRPANKGDTVEIEQRRGEDAEQRGRALWDRHSHLGKKAFCRITPTELEACGGKEGFIQYMVEFFRRMKVDPVFVGLFNASNPDSDVGAEEHGKRMALWILCRHGSWDDYKAYRGDDVFDNIGSAHARAKQCPFRTPTNHRGHNFTVTQRDRWLGYQWQAMTCCGAPQAVRDRLVKMYAGYALPLMEMVEGPFLDTPHGSPNPMKDEQCPVTGSRLH